MNEAYLKVNNLIMYCRHNGIVPERKTLLFVHGLGDSGLSFEDAYHFRWSDNYNIIVPDLIGYGRSSGSPDPKDYGYDAHVARLRSLIKRLELKDIILVGHSMGGDLTTLMCGSDSKKVIRKFISIEGDVTQYDLTISRMAVKADKNKRFASWYENDFKQKLVYEKLGKERSGRIYYASLAFCRTEAFLENAKELVARNTALEGKFKSEIGEKFVALDVPKVFCYGTASLAKSSLRFLEQNKIKTKAFEGIRHCPMTDAPKEFYKFLHEYIKKKS